MAVTPKDIPVTVTVAARPRMALALQDAMAAPRVTLVIRGGHVISGRINRELSDLPYEVHLLTPAGIGGWATVLAAEVIAVQAHPT